MHFSFVESSMEQFSFDAFHPFLNAKAYTYVDEDFVILNRIIQKLSNANASFTMILHE